jgi:hypothetical protein
MMQSNRRSISIRVSLMLLSLGIATGAVARSLPIETKNSTPLKWNAQECVGTTCVKFPLDTDPVFKRIPQPASNTVYLGAFFVNVDTAIPPVACSEVYTVRTASTALVTVQKSSGTYTCQTTITKR